MNNGDLAKCVDMTFTEDAIEKLRDEYHQVNSRYHKLLRAFVSRKYNDSSAQEYATHGFPRRLRLLTRCIHNVFEFLPPESKEIPSDDARIDATINIHAFVFGTFGAIDNLAWIWVCEKKIKKSDGTLIPKSWIGLGPENIFVRETFSEKMQCYLQELNPWFEHLATFRHALAHRISPYIPPHLVKASNEVEYKEFDTLKNAAIARGDFEEEKRLSAEQMKLAFFRPWMQPSFSEGASAVYFHPQLLADFKTVDLLAWKVLEELNV
jgi:hypothetical protein